MLLTAKLSPFQHIFQQILSFLSAVFSPFSLRSVTSSSKHSSWCLPLLWPCFFATLLQTFSHFLTYSLCSPIILSLRAVSLPYIEEYLSLLFFLYALLFSPPLCRRSILFFFFQLKSLSGVTHNSTISTAELVLESLALFLCLLTYFISFQYFLQFSCSGFLILP